MSVLFRDCVLSVPLDGTVSSVMLLPTGTTLIGCSTRHTDDSDWSTWQAVLNCTQGKSALPTLQHVKLLVYLFLCCFYQGF